MVILMKANRIHNLLKQLFLLFILVSAYQETQAAYFEGFENVGNITNNNDPLKWAWLNKSQSPGQAGTDPSIGGWWQGVAAESFFAQAGSPDSFARADFRSTGANVISNWFITPTFDFVAGDTFSFYTRTITNSNYPDRLQILQSTSGTSINVGPDFNSVGNFSTMLGEINKDLVKQGYPETWTQFTYNITSSFTGRIGFRYYVTDVAAATPNGNYIGLDTFSTTANLFTPVPEPSTYFVASAATGLLMLARRYRMPKCMA